MRKMTVLGRQERIPPFPHPKDYAYRCNRFFEARTLLSFVSIANFRVIREAINGFRYKCGIPRDILIDPTNACNIHCTGCWANDYDNKQHLTYEKMDEILTEAEKLGTMDILLTGGEPLLRKNDILRLAAKHRRLFFGAFTNGTLIDEDFVKKIAELGNMTVFVSLEGFREDTDARRGKGVYDKVMNAMRLLKEYGIAFGFSICYHRDNYRSVVSDEFLDFLREQGAWYGWAFGYRPVGKNADVALCLDAQERAYVRSQVNDYSRRNDFTIIDLFNNGHKAYGCVGAGNGYIHINASGDVEPCAFCHYADSNLHEVTLQKALQSPFFRAFRNAQPFSANSLRPCPMMDVPEAIVEVVGKTGARSTHASCPETAQEFAGKVKQISDEWATCAESEAKNLTRGEKRRFRFLQGYLALKRQLSGDGKADR